MRTGGYIYSSTTENVQMKSGRCRMVASSIKQNFPGMRGTSNQVTFPFIPIFKAVFLKRSWKKARILGKQKEKLLESIFFSCECVCLFFKVLFSHQVLSSPCLTSPWYQPPRQSSTSVLACGQVAGFHQAIGEPGVYLKISLQNRAHRLQGSASLGKIIVP